MCDGDHAPSFSGLCQAISNSFVSCRATIDLPHITPASLIVPLGRYHTVRQQPSLGQYIYIFFFDTLVFFLRCAGRTVSPATSGTPARGGGGISAGALQGVDTYGGVLVVRGGQRGRFAPRAGPRGADAGQRRGETFMKAGPSRRG